jgi:crotonobetainyl-CoA:carnitine CoA-transferase CaiB-like acyl-CoA transferase
MHLLQAHGVAAGAVLKGIDVIHEPHLQARGFWDTVEHPEAGQYIQVTTPWKLSRDQRQTAVPAPGLGEHNGYVLSELLGLPEGELEDLETQGIIGARPVGA